MYTSKITSQGTISLPAPLRKKFGLKTGDILSLEDNGTITIRPVQDFATLRTQNAQFKANVPYKQGDGFNAYITEKYAKE